jgi:uncharacterized protein YeeX (DUF496 family)
MKSETKRQVQEILKKVKDQQTRQLIFDSYEQVIDAAVRFFYEELKKKRRL